MVFEDRTDAGRHLAAELAHYAGRDDVVVLALPRGGLPVAAEVATALGVPLDVLVVRKLGVPGYEELALGAVAAGGGRVLNERLVRELGLTAEEVEEIAAREARELARREREYRGGRPPLDVRGKTVILVDDGLATGASMRAAVAAVRRLGPDRVVVAAPVGAAETCRVLAREADEVVCPEQPDPFFAVGQWYADFSQTTDAEVRALLTRAGGGPGRLPPGGSPPPAAGSSPARPLAPARSG